MRFSDHMVAEVSQTFWAAMARGEFITGAAAEACQPFRTLNRVGWLESPSFGNEDGLMPKDTI